MKKSLLTLMLMVAMLPLMANAFEQLADGVYQDGSTLYITSGVTSIEGLNLNPSIIYSFALIPPACVNNTFADYGATLHMPAASYAAYFIAEYWGNFANMYNDAVEPTEVALSNSEVELIVGNTINLSVSIAPSNVSLHSVEWSSTDPQVATVTSGKVTAIGTGECDIVAFCLDKRAVCHITVSMIEVTAIVLNQEEALLEVNEQLSLTATVTPENATYSTVTWSTTDANVATVNNGLVTAVGQGECDIIATCDGLQAVCHITVSMIEVTAIVLNQEEALLEVNEQLSLTATVTPENATYSTVTWSTTDANVATVNNGLVTAVGQGECDIIATCGGLQTVCHVIVIPKKIYIMLDKHTAYVLPNHMITLTPSMTPVSSELKAISSNPSVAAVRIINGTVQVVGVTEGTATVTVSSVDGYAFTDTCKVTVYTEMGDVNCDGFINISDVTMLIDFLLSNNLSTIKDMNADVNRDNSINIADVTTLIDYLLSNNWPFESFTVNGVTFNMIYVEGGTFTMGVNGNNWDDESSPPHQVTLSSFCIGQTEVTQELWKEVMGNNPSWFKSSTNNNYGDNFQRPVERVSWNACQQFISKLNELTGKNFRLPTEAEWEYAARGGNKSQGYGFSGSDNINNVAWYYANGNNRITHPVATKAPNELGIYDMSGNVWEWCQDWYGPYSGDSQINPTGPESGYYPVRRGGSWGCAAGYCTVTFRGEWESPRSTASTVHNFIGLRLAL